MATQQRQSPATTTTPYAPAACVVSMPASEAGSENQDHLKQQQQMHQERAEQVQRAQWLRAAILGANDGLLSTTLLMLGVGAAKEDRWSMIVSGLAGTVAGACSMAVGEFVSVSTQRDIEKGGRGELSLAADESKSTGSPACTAVTPGHRFTLPVVLAPPDVTPNGKVTCTTPTSSLALKIILEEVESKGAAGDLQGSSTSAIPALKTIPEGVESKGAARDLKESSTPATPARRSSMASPSPRRSPLMRVIMEDGNTQRKSSDSKDGDGMLPSPFKAASASALAFMLGSLVPLVAAMFIADYHIRIVMLPIAASIALAILGGAGAHLGGSPMLISAVRVLIGGWIAMAIAYGLLKPFDRREKHEG